MHISIELFGWRVEILDFRIADGGFWLKLFELENGYQDEYTRLTLLWVNVCRHFPWINLLTVEQEGFNYFPLESMPGHQTKSPYHWIRGLVNWSRGNPELTSWLWRRGSWSYGDDTGYTRDRKLADTQPTGTGE